MGWKEIVKDFLSLRASCILHSVCWELLNVVVSIDQIKYGTYLYFMYFPSFCGRSHDLTHWPQKTIWWPSGVQNARVHATTGPPAFAINAACSPAGPAACKDPG